MTVTLSLNTISPHIWWADYYPFEPGEKSRQRRSYMHSFIYIKSGRGTITIDDINYKAGEGSLFYVPPDISHRFVSDHTIPMTHASIYFDFVLPAIERQINFTLFCFADETFDAARCTDQVAWEEDLKLETHVMLPRHAEWIGPFFEIIDRIESAELGLKLETRSLFGQFFVAHLRYVASSHKLTDPRIRKLIHLMKEGQLPHCSVSELAERIGVSTAYFFELFHKETGQSPMAYWQRCRLEFACKILRESNDSITSIAERCGFSSIHYFTRQFNQTLGESPSRYRARLREYH